MRANFFLGSETIQRHLQAMSLSLQMLCMCFQIFWWSHSIFGQLRVLVNRTPRKTSKCWDIITQHFFTHGYTWVCRYMDVRSASVSFGDVLTRHITCTFSRTCNLLSTKTGCKCSATNTHYSYWHQQQLGVQIYGSPVWAHSVLELFDQAHNLFFFFTHNSNSSGRGPYNE